MEVRPIEILLVEDNPGDIRLTQEALRDGKLANHLSIATDGEMALARLYRAHPYEGAPRPDLILLDLNLPKVSGQEILARLQADPSLSSILVVVLTLSREEYELLRALQLGAAAYMTKPVDFPQLIGLVQEIEAFHLSIVLPTTA